MPVDRRAFLETTAAAAAAALALPRETSANRSSHKSNTVMTKPCNDCRNGSGSRPSPPKTAA